MLEIFRSGNFTDMNGKDWSFTDEDVKATTDAYDPAVFRAPLVVGHPKTDDPAFGWVKSLTFNDDKKLLSESEQVAPEFSELVNAGRYPKISASFFHPTSKANPVPGVWYLRHVGFLGAAAPAVPGLATASFSGTDDELVTIEFGECDNSKAFTVTNKQTEEDSIVIKDTDQEKTAEFAQRETKLQTREAELKAREEAQAKKEKADREAGFASFAAQMVEKNHLLPAEKDNVANFMAHLDDTETVSFADGDGNTDFTPSEFFKKFVAGLPPRVDFAERSADENDEHVSHASFSVPAGATVDAAKLAVHNKAMAYKAKHNCSYDAALAATGA